ncbi:MAG: c-type cytochrome biogenesis protein CcmI [Paracoccaceae bacterium]
MVFWLPALLIAAVATVLIVLGVVRGGRVAAAEAAGKRDIAVYKAQLREIDEDRAKGTVSDEEAERLRTEVARRLLEADKAADRQTAESPRAARGVVIGAAVALPVAAMVLYWQVGIPGYEDMPLVARQVQAQEIREARLSQAELETRWNESPDRPAAPEAEPQYLELMQRLRDAVAQRPNDAQGLRLLAVNEGNLGNFSASAAAWSRLIDLQGPSAPVEDLVAMAESMIIATGGLVSPEADRVLSEVLRRDDRNGSARYYMGLMFAQTGRPDITFRLWRGLLEDSQPDDPWVPAIRGTIEELATVAGVRYTLPPLAATGARGPSAADVAAAADMTDEERQQMIGGMVEQLAQRLGSQGGTSQEWARLVSSLVMLGQTDRARGILAEARLVFAQSAEDLAVIEDAAARAGFGN